MSKVRGVTGPLTAIIAVVTLPLGILTGIVAGLEAAAIVFVVGWLFLVPMIPIVGEGLLPAIHEKIQSEDNSADTPNDALTDLKKRYVQGELEDEEFERRVEQHLATENLRDLSVSNSEQLTQKQPVESEQN